MRLCSEKERKLKSVFTLTVHFKHVLKLKDVILIRLMASFTHSHIKVLQELTTKNKTTIA